MPIITPVEAAITDPKFSTDNMTQKQPEDTPRLPLSGMSNATSPVRAATQYAADDASPSKLVLAPTKIDDDSSSTTPSEDFSEDDDAAVKIVKTEHKLLEESQGFDEPLLKENPHVFYHARTPRCLAHFWQSLKAHTLLPDQAVQPLPKDNHILNFLDAEAAINDGELFEERDTNLDHELRASDRRQD